MAVATRAGRDSELHTRAFALALAAIVALAALVRLWRIGWGLDDALAFGDENFYWAASLRPFLSSFKGGMLVEGPITYPTLFPLFAGGVARLFTATGQFDAIPGPTPEMKLILIGRVVSAIFGALTVLLGGIVARRAYSERAGLAAAMLLAVAPLEVLQVHIVSVDTLVDCLGVATLLAALEIERRGSGLAALAGGVAAGLGFAAKYTGLAYLVAPLWAALEVAWRSRSAARLAVLGGAIVAGALLATLSGCPQCVLRSDLMLAAMAIHLRFETSYAFWATNNHLTPSLGWYGRPYLYELVASLPWGLGWPLGLLGLIGIVHALRRHTPADRLILVLLATYFAAMGRSQVTWPRYLLPLYPGIAILAGRWIADGPLRPRLRLATLVGVFAYTLVLSATQVARLSWDQQKGIVAWLQSELAPRLSPGATLRVGFPWWSGDYFNLRAVLSRAGIEPVTADQKAWLADRPDAFILPEWIAVAVKRDWSGRPEARELARLQSGEAGYHPVARWESRYLQEGFYTRLDPAFTGDLWQGETGFTLYARDDLLAGDAPAPHDAAPPGRRD